MGDIAPKKVPEPSGLPFSVPLCKPPPWGLGASTDIAADPEATATPRVSGLPEAVPIGCLRLA